MKRYAIITLLMSLAVSAFALMPENFVGKWESGWFDDQIFTDVSTRQKCTYVFYPDSTMTGCCELENTIKIPKDPNAAFQTYYKVKCTFYVTYKGTWTVDADSLLIIHNQVSLRVEYPEEEIVVPSEVPEYLRPPLRRRIYNSTVKRTHDIGITDTPITNIKMTLKGGKRKFTCIDGNHKVTYHLIEEYKPEEEPDTKGTKFPRGIMSAL